MTELWIVLLLCPSWLASIPLHEIGHYIIARLLGCKAKIYWKPHGHYTMSCMYTPKTNMSNHEMYAISFAGIIGLAAYLPYIALSSDISLSIFIVILLSSYSLYEVYQRRKEQLTSLRQTDEKKEKP